MIRPLLICLCLLMFTSSVFAQTNIVTADDVNEVARRLYCPVCENIPLSDCGMPTCLEWKDEIYRQLTEGRTPQTIIDYFVARYGQHVVGIPQDPGLRFLAFIIPIVASIIALIWGVMTFTRWRQGQTRIVQPVVTGIADETDYRQIIERDL